MYAGVHGSDLWLVYDSNRWVRTIAVITAVAARQILWLSMQRLIIATRFAGWVTKDMKDRFKIKKSMKVLLLCREATYQAKQHLGVYYEHETTSRHSHEINIDKTLQYMVKKYNGRNCLSAGIADEILRLHYLSIWGRHTHREIWIWVKSFVQPRR